MHATLPGGAAKARFTSLDLSHEIDVTQPKGSRIKNLTLTAARPGPSHRLGQQREVFDRRWAGKKWTDDRAPLGKERALAESHRVVLQ